LRIDNRLPGAPDTSWENAVRRAIGHLRYGSVEVVVHDGHVVQIETRERVRFTDPRPPDDRRRSQQHDARADRNSGSTAATPSEETDG
jgi:hypothetical protein